MLCIRGVVYAWWRAYIQVPWTIHARDSFWATLCFWFISYAIYDLLLFLYDYMSSLNHARTFILSFLFFLIVNGYLWYCVLLVLAVITLFTCTCLCMYISYVRLHNLCYLWCVCIYFVYRNSYMDWGWCTWVGEMSIVACELSVWVLLLLARKLSVQCMDLDPSLRSQVIAYCTLGHVCTGLFDTWGVLIVGASLIHTWIL